MHQNAESPSVRHGNWRGAVVVVARASLMPDGGPSACRMTGNDAAKASSRAVLAATVPGAGRVLRAAESGVCSAAGVLVAIAAVLG